MADELRAALETFVVRHLTPTLLDPIIEANGRAMIAA